jgi:PAS domain S-box-containing protein
VYREGVLPEAALSEFGVGRLLDLVRDAVVLGEAESGRVVLWNEAAEAMFGYPRSEAIGMPLENLVPERLRARHRAGLAGYAATGRGPLIDSATVFEVPARRKDDRELTVELSLSPIGEPGTAGRFVLAIARDVTERERLRREAEQARLDGALLAARCVAHRVNDLLMLVSGNAQLLGAEATGDAALLARDIVDDAAAAAAVIVRLGQIVRIEEATSPAGPMLDLEKSTRPPVRASGRARARRPRRADRAAHGTPTGTDRPRGPEAAGP